MDVEFSDHDLETLEADPTSNGGYSQAIVRSFRKLVNLIRAATDERDFYAMKSLHFEKLKGKRSNERSMRINDQWRLILEIQPGKPKNKVVIRGIEDYH